MAMSPSASKALRGVEHIAGRPSTTPSPAP